MHLKFFGIRIRAAGVALLLLGALAGSRAITITNGPSFSPAPLAPLSGVLQVATDVPSRVSVSVSDGYTSWQKSFYDYNTTHTLPLLGFKPSRTNLVTVTVLDKERNSFTSTNSVTFVSPALPAYFPTPTVFTNQPSKMEPGFTLFRLLNETANQACLTAVDNNGEVVWYCTAPSVLDVRQLSNGNLFVPLSTNFVEMDMLGNVSNSWNVPDGLTINYHDGVLTSRNTILYITDQYTNVDNFPEETFDPEAPLGTVNALYNRIIEISATNGVLLNEWSLPDMLQMSRFDYLTYSVGYADLEHANAILDVPGDDSIIVSMRHQDALVKFSRLTGQIKWILGNPSNWDSQFQQYLLTPVGQPFEWCYGQHGPMLTPSGTLMVYDDGPYRASPFDNWISGPDNYSRAVEYSINEQTMEISQVWDFSGTNTDRLFTLIVGNADALPKTGNVLVCFGAVQYENGQSPSPVAPGASGLRMKEVTHDANPEVVFDLSFFNYANTSPDYLGFLAYRAHRIPDLYPVLPVPVQDLTIQYAGSTAFLQFSANEASTYMVQESDDLANWQTVGQATATGNGNYTYLDESVDPTSNRYYRIISQ